MIERVRQREVKNGESQYVVECMVYGVESEYRNQLMDLTRVINLPLPFLIFPNPLLFTSLPPLYLSPSSLSHLIPFISSLLRYIFLFSYQADKDLTGIAPNVVTIAWLEKASSSYDYPKMEIYLRWQLSRLNADKYLLPFTRLELRHEVLDKSTSSGEFTAACERVRREAEAEGKPVVGFLSSGSSRTKDVLKMASPLPTVAYSSTQAILESKSKYPWLVRMFPSDSQRVDATVKMMRSFGWSKMFMMVDQNSQWATSLAKDITDKGETFGIKMDNWWTPNLRDMAKVNVTKANLAAAAKHARANGFKVIVLAMSKYVELAVRALYDEGLYGKGIVIIGSAQSYFARNEAAFVGAERNVLDSSMVLTESGIDRTLEHSIATMAEWPGGKGTFLTNANMLNGAYALDGLQLFAYSIDATISRGKSPLIAAELMSSLRITTVSGLTGRFKIDRNWNNIRSRRCVPVILGSPIC